MAVALADTILFDGRPISPGETFHPFPEHPDYEVMFLGIEGSAMRLADCCGEFTKEV